MVNCLSLQTISTLGLDTNENVAETLSGYCYQIRI